MKVECLILSPDLSCLFAKSCCRKGGGTNGSKSHMAYRPYTISVSSRRVSNTSESDSNSFLHQDYKTILGFDSTLFKNSDHTTGYNFVS